MSSAFIDWSILSDRRARDCTNSRSSWSWQRGARPRWYSYLHPARGFHGAGSRDRADDLWAMIPNRDVRVHGRHMALFHKLTNKSNGGGIPN